MRKIIFPVFILILVSILNVSVPGADQTVPPVFDFSKLENGIVGINYASSSGRSIKLMIQKDGQRYFYDLAADGSSESFTLQMGDGKYYFSILENTSYNTYRCTAKKYAYVQGLDDRITYLNSVQNICWNEDMEAIKKAYALTKDKNTAYEKVAAIYEYIVKNVRYDRSISGVAASGYIPDIEETFTTNTGICYDYSALFAAMLRSQGIPAKLVTGYNPYVSGYHAWNEVYIEDTDEWVFIDTTVDAAYKRSGSGQMIKDMGNYKIRYVY